MSQAVRLNDQLRARVASPSDDPQNRASRNAAAPRVRVRPVALPVEHGGWGLTLEPAALGLVVAPSVAGCFLAVAALFAFLARHPLKIVLGDRRRGRRFPRTALAEKLALAYSLAAAASFVAALAVASNYEFLCVVAAALPLAAVQLYFDGAGRSRTLLPELAGSIAMASVAACIALAAGWSFAPAVALSAALAARFLPSILYVRAALARLHGREFPTLAPIAAHIFALIVVGALAATKLLTPFALVPFAVLLLRAARGLHGKPRAGATARRVGFKEIGYGALTVVVIAAGRLLGA